MYRIPVILMAALPWFLLAAGCNVESSNSVTEETEFELLISDPDFAPEEILPLIDFVSYRITCPDSGLTPIDDSVDLNGNFEVSENRNPPVWQLITELPLSTCTIALWVFEGDEVICEGSEVVPILDDDDPNAPSKVNIELVCSLSTNYPSGDIDIDGDFTFINGNFCPSLVWLGAVPIDIPPSSAATTTLTTSALDPDDSCGLNCDPQTCDFTQNPPVCSPAANPGFSTTFVAPAGNGTFDDAVMTGNPIDTATTYTCDPAYPGPTEICVIASDGDNDCDQIRCITILCPDICDGVVCNDDGDSCTRESCSPVDGQCVTDVAPDGLACNDCSNTCVAGACTGPAWTGAITGTNMSFVGSVQTLNQTLTNPYSGATVTLDGPFNVNTSSYQGTAGVDTLIGTNLGDFLQSQEPVGNQTICGVERVITNQSFDAMILADAFVVHGNMIIQGGLDDDVIWANVGNDLVRGNSGNDLLDGGPGDDAVEGGPGDDTITLWPGSGFDRIDGGGETDTVQVDAIASQIEITPSVDALYEFDLFYRGVALARVRAVEVLELEDTSFNLTLCSGVASDVCNLCGNDALNGGEECDDGNNVDGDGCASDCTAEF